MDHLPRHRQQEYKEKLRRRVLEKNEQLLVPIMSTLTSPMTRKIVDIYTDNLNGDESTFIALTYPQPGEILKLFEGRDTISNDDYICLEDEFKKCKKMFQFWSADYDKQRDLHLKHMLDVYTKGSWILYTVTNMLEDLVKATGEKDSRFVFNYYFGIAANIIESRTFKEDFSVHHDYYIKPLTMEHFYGSVIENLREQFGREPTLRSDQLKISLLFGLFPGIFTKYSDKLVGWISLTYAGEIGSLYVDPKHRNNGLGHSLWYFIKRKAKQINVFSSGYVKQPRNEKGKSYVSFSGVLGFKQGMSKL
uniref:N-acetyltransferase domain-containing protein n=1 Tax=Clytia hemisphaerica TaxID=252671 RepID=A0A7M5XGS6_9CNID